MKRNTKATTASKDGQWPVPELSDVKVAFPANALDWMPPMDEIPEEFRHDRTIWNEIVGQWFYRGMPSTVEFYPKKGIDPAKAVRAIQATLGSFAPKHEHKEAATAYMPSCWFERVTGWD